MERRRKCNGETERNKEREHDLEYDGPKDGLFGQIRELRQRPETKLESVLLVVRAAGGKATGFVCIPVCISPAAAHTKCCRTLPLHPTF